MAKKDPLLAVVRIRGRVDQNYKVQHTLKLLNLTRANHAVIIPNDETHLGMLKVVKDAVTWGEVDKSTVKDLIQKRGRIEGNNPITAKFLKQHGISTIASFVKDLFDGKADMRRIDGMKPLFRLNPPRKGYKNVKKSTALHGDLGYRGKEINDLLEKMM